MKNPHAVALGKLGGKARLENTTPEQRAKWAGLGGKARLKNTTPEQRSKWARMGGRPPKKGKRNAN
jgi:hypothetical protein